MKTLLLIIGMFTTTAYSRTITLQPGECQWLNGTKICATNSVNTYQVERESFTKEGNVHCICSYGIRPVSNPSDPMKGHWLVSVDTTTGQQQNLTNFGSNENACQKAIKLNSICRSGRIDYKRYSRGY